MIGRHVLVLGLGESGLAMARWCVAEGATVRVADTRAAPPGLDALRAISADVDVRLGPFDAALLDGIDLIAISPGLAPNAEPQRSLLAAAGVEVVGEIELFARKLAALKTGTGYAPQVVAITGTNGKTTVTRLVGRLCASAGRATLVAGNVSPAALDALAEALERRQLPDVWVLELSSFQLETTKSLAADVATVLNVTQDHLDWHGDFDAYLAAKASVFAARSTIRVLNRDDARVMAMASDGVPSVTFGLAPPVTAGSFGVVSDGQGDDAFRWLALAEGDDPDAEARGALAPRGRKRVARKTAEPLQTKRLMPVDALAIRGDHNVANVLAALAIGRAIGLPMSAMLFAAAAYRGEPHRMERIATHDGIEWIEDSKGTNVGATVAALTGLRRTVVLIAGGDGKGQDFGPLAAPVAAHARAVLLIGKDKGVLRAALAATGVPIDDFDTLDDAVVAAAGIAEPGDVVLLSPACASLDMFRDYRERADVFVGAVHRLHESEEATC